MSLNKSFIKIKLKVNYNIIFSRLDETWRRIWTKFKNVCKYLTLNVFIDFKEVKLCMSVCLSHLFLCNKYSWFYGIFISASTFLSVHCPAFNPNLGGRGKEMGGGGVIPPIGFPLKLRNGTSCNSGILQHLVTFY